MYSEIKEYFEETPVFKDGLYSNFDARYLYSTIRYLKPEVVLDLGTRQGKTTSSAIGAIIKNISENNGTVEYYIFEKDIRFLCEIQTYVNDIIKSHGLQDQITVSYNENIIDSSVLNQIDNIDFLLLDGNHDYIFAKWYIEHLFKKVGIGGMIHIHDIYYDNYGSGWADTRMCNNGPHHPDYSNLNNLKQLYPTIFEKYYDGNPIITKYESDIIEEFYMKNTNNIDFYSTLKISKEIEQYDNFKKDQIGNCTVYFLIKNKIIC